MYGKSKLVLLVDWVFDWFILPWYQSLKGATLHHKAEDDADTSASSTDA